MINLIYILNNHQESLSMEVWDFSGQGTVHAQPLYPGLNFLLMSHVCFWSVSLFLINFWVFRGFLAFIFFYLFYSLVSVTCRVGEGYFLKGGVM